MFTDFHDSTMGTVAEGRPPDATVACMQMPLGATANMTSASCGGMGCTGLLHLSMKHAFADLLCPGIADLVDSNMDRRL